MDQDFERFFAERGSRGANLGPNAWSVSSTPSPYESPDLFTTGDLPTNSSITGSPYPRHQNSRQPTPSTISTGSSPTSQDDQYGVVPQQPPWLAPPYSIMRNPTGTPSSTINHYMNPYMLNKPPTLPTGADRKRRSNDQQERVMHTPPAPSGHLVRSSTMQSLAGPMLAPAIPQGALEGSQPQYLSISGIIRDHDFNTSTYGSRGIFRTNYNSATSPHQGLAFSSLPKTIQQSHHIARQQAAIDASARISATSSVANVETKSKADKYRLPVPNTSTPSAKDSAEKIMMVKPADAAISPGVRSPRLSQLDFDPDVQPFGSDPLYFMTVGDREKAQGRGFETAYDVYEERKRRANIETTDINLAWVPGPGKHGEGFPWQPICGSAAYILGVRGHLRPQYMPGETLYKGSKEYKADDVIDIPMFHNIREVLWNKKEFCRTTYAHARTTSSDGEESQSFVPSQSEWRPTNLPPSAAILEPLKAGKSTPTVKLPYLVDKAGNVVKDKRGQPRRAFDHVLPTRISAHVEGWELAAWVAEDPRIQWRDVEAHIASEGKIAGRLNDRYFKYRDGLSTMLRSVITTGKKVVTKTDLKTVEQQSHENLVGNSWWFVDLNKEMICQSQDPMTALLKGLPAYPLPLRRTNDGEYSERVHHAKGQMTVKERDKVSEGDSTDLYKVLADTVESSGEPGTEVQD